MDRYAGPHTPLTITLHRGFYLDIITDRYKGRILPYYSIAYSPLINHYNGRL
jgi:hypothetical protein